MGPLHSLSSASSSSGAFLTSPSSLSPLDPSLPHPSSVSPSANTSFHAPVPSRYVADFEEIEFLGRGGFGEVVKVRNRLDDRLYAIKRILVAPGDRKIFREVKLLSRLHHQHVVRYYTTWMEDGSHHSRIHSSDQTIYPSKVLFIQMEFCDGQTLRDAIDVGIQLQSEGDVWRVFRQIIDALIHIHAQGIVHRDLKPSNIFMDTSGNVKIGDFGLATSSQALIDEGTPRELADSMATTMTGGMGGGTGGIMGYSSLTSGVGTSFYLSPEMTSNKHLGVKYTQKVDIYSLGIIFFEMCYPFSTAMERAKTLIDLRDSKVILPQDFPMDRMRNQALVIQWLLRHPPAERPTSLELSRSNLLPPQMEDAYLEEVARTI
ncbi:kinase-like domain-containing protein, partial [Piptocephalis cylindrospora]